MLDKNSFVIFVFSLIVICESAFVDHLTKCALSDSECQRSSIQSALQDVGKTGIPEYGIPPTDPFMIKNISVSVLNMIDITMLEGVARGVKDCVVNKYETHIEKRKAIMDLTCDLIIKGKYKAYGNSPLIQNLLGGATVHGEGKTKLVIDKINMHFNYHFAVREKNGDNFIIFVNKDLKYSYNVGKMTFAANNLYLGEAEASELIVGVLNDNWKFIIETFGKPFLDKAMSIVYEQTSKFFEVVPAKYYVIDDLTPYVTKD